MKLVRVLLSVFTVVSLLALGMGACGDDDTTVEPTPTVADATPTPVLATPTPTEVAPTPTEEPTPTATPEPAQQPAVWPAPDTVVSTAGAAAADFVSSVLQVPPRLGEFQAGDSRSGEIEVLAPPETDVDGVPFVRSLLLVRKLGPSDGWFVLAAVNEDMAITAPESGAEVPPAMLTVTGIGQGFEGLVVVEAFVAGESTPLDMVLAQGGSTGTSEPYEVELDLSGAAVGDTVLVIAHGGVGLETDPGQFSALPVVIGEG